MNEKTRKQQSEGDDLWGSSKNTAAAPLGLGAAGPLAGTGMLSGAMGAMGAMTAMNAAKRPAKKPWSIFSRKKAKPAAASAAPPMTLTPIAAPAASTSKSKSKSKPALSRSSSRTADDAASEAEGILGDFAGSGSEPTSPETPPSRYRIAADMGSLLNDGPGDFSEEEAVADLTELDGPSSSSEEGEEGAAEVEAPPPANPSLYITQAESPLRDETAALPSAYQTAPVTTMYPPAPGSTNEYPAPASSYPVADSLPVMGNHDDTEISEDEPVDNRPMSQGQSDYAHAQRKDRARYGTLVKPTENAEGYTPRKINDVDHWDENKQYFQPGLVDAAKAAGVTARTKYYNDEERAEHRVNVKDGLLTGAGGSLLDTSKAAAPMADGAQGGRHIFAMTHENELYSADAIGENDASTQAVVAGNSGQGPKQAYLDRTHHSTFVEGKAVDEFGNFNYEASKGVKGAGEIKVNEGWLSRISNVSGHYVPDIKNTHATLKALDAQGLNMDATTVENLTRGANGKKTDTYQARAMLASNMDLDLLDAHKGAFEQIRAGVNLKATAPAAPANGDAWWKEAYRAGDKSAGPKVARPNADKESLAEYKDWKVDRFADTAAEDLD